MLPIRNALEGTGIKVRSTAREIKFSHGDEEFSCMIVGENFLFLPDDHIEGINLIPLDYLITAPRKIATLAQSRLGLNNRVFGRNCDLRKVDKKNAEIFFSEHHLMNYAGSAYNLGLFSGQELVALAAFSKGRRMDRLETHERSFELIRFCSRSGTTVVGGLSRLLNNFCSEKGAADVMTYVDRMLSDGSSFIKAGFLRIGLTLPNYFLINRTTFERKPTTLATRFNDKYYLTKNFGNIKLLYIPGKQKPRTSAG